MFARYNVAMWGWLQKQRQPRVADDSRAIRQYPELAYFDGPEERGKAIVAAVAAARRGMEIWLVLIMVILTVAGALLHASVSLYLRGSRFESTWNSMRGAFFGPMFIFATLIVLRLRRRRIDRSLREQLVRRGFPICMRCGYDLRGQTEPRCPECGVPFDPELIKHEGVALPVSTTATESSAKKLTRRERKAARRLLFYPELSWFPEHEREGVWAAAGAGSRFWTIGAWVLGFGGAATVFVLTKWLLVPRMRFTPQPWLPHLTALMALTVFTSLSMVIARWRVARQVVRFLRTQLNLRGHPVCMRCGYDLKGLDEAKCPECRTAFERSTSTHDQGHAADAS